MRTTTSLSEGRAYLFLTLFGERRVRDSPISLSVVFCFAVPAIHSDLPELRCHRSAVGSARQDGANIPLGAIDLVLQNELLRKRKPAILT